MIGASYNDHMGDDLSVVNAARVSFAKYKDELDASDHKLIKYLAKHKHFTPFEHCILSVNIKCPLYIRSQIHRHRTFSYNEISRRYTEENLSFYIPKQLRRQHEKSKQCSAGELNREGNALGKSYIKMLHKEALDVYNELLKMGVARELARGVLPQNLMTEFIMTGNLRNWIQFLVLRLDSHAQEEAQIIAKEVKDIISSKFPISSKALFTNLGN